MKEIKTREELKEALNKTRSVVMFGKADCLHCTIVRNCIKSVEKHFPLIDFYFTENRDFSNARNISSFPVVVFYENGIEQGTMVGSNHITLIRDILNLWFKKD